VCRMRGRGPGSGGFGVELQRQVRHLRRNGPLIGLDCQAEAGRDGSATRSLPRLSALPPTDSSGAEPASWRSITRGAARRSSAAELAGGVRSAATMTLS
jgi:hypothetical protein